MQITDSDVLYWHPRFKLFPFSNHSLILLSENEVYFLAGEKYRLLVSMVDGQHTMQDILQQTSGISQNAQLWGTIDQLLTKKLLSNEAAVAKNYHDATSRVEISPTRIGDFLVYNLSICLDVLPIVQQLSIDPSVSLIFVDDYLDERLQKINEVHLKNKTPFLLFKLTGERWYVGPWVTAQSKQPCWQCLATQMLNNKPVKKWLQSQNYNTITSVYYADQLPDYKQIGQLVQQVIEQSATLLEILPTDRSKILHSVNHRPQCSACGEAGYLSRQLSKPVKLSSAPKQANVDGGSRVMPSSDTVKSVEPFISPLTGVITNLMPFPSMVDLPVTIYRTAFFRTPPAFQKPAQDAFLQVCLGKGINDDQTKASALCECIERFAAQFQGDEEWKKSLPEELEAKYYLPQQLVPMSENQYQQFALKNYTVNETKYAVQKYASDQPLHWAKTWSLTYHEQVYLPFTYCFGNAPFEDDQFIHWNSNGCAAGNNLEEAVLQGFLELVERDATAIWWYNKIERPSIDLETLSDDQVAKIEQTLGKEWDFWVLDLTNDMGIPVMAGVGQHKQTKKFCLGFGCHLNAQIACQRALTELCQLIPIRDQNNAPFDFDAIAIEPFLMPQNTSKEVKSFDLLETNDIKTDIMWCVEKAQQIGLETLVLNYSRPDLPIKTVKVVVPGLCHMWPQLAAKRLYEVPVKMGWLDIVYKENELNPMALYI